MPDSYVVSTALMTCTFGMAPCPLTVNPSRTKMIGGMQQANIMDYIPMVNIPSFGMCTAPTYPAVIAATAAAGAMQLATAKMAADQAEGLYQGGYSDDYEEGYTRKGNPREQAGVKCVLFCVKPFS